MTHTVWLPKAAPRAGPALLFAVLLLMHSGLAHGQSARADRFYYPGGFNWSLLKAYPEAAQLFNGFDYGHSVLYERLYTKDEHLGADLEREYRFLTTDLLVDPPRYSIAEEVVAPAYSKAMWRAQKMFQWAHTLHRQVYDVYASDQIADSAKEPLIERLIDYYLANRPAAFSVVPKAMRLMEDQPYSQVFRQGFPKFNGLIWGYHWLQVGLYESLLEGPAAQKRAAVGMTLAHFWAMVQSPSRFPTVMPMTSAVAPRFAKRHPRAAIIFDNLHMMHDIISDILVSPLIPASGKATAIETALAEFRDGTRNTMDMDEWWMMGEMMGGVERMGGVPPRELP